MIELFSAIKARWGQANVPQTIPGGIFTTEPPERTTPRPYAVIEPVAETVIAWTNKGKYTRPQFMITVVDLTFELVGMELAVVHAALDFSPLTMAVVRNLRIFPIADRFFPEDQYWKGIAEFGCELGYPVTYFPQ